MKRFNYTKLKTFFKKFPRTLAENSFFTFLGLTFLSVLLGLIIFYWAAIGIDYKTNVKETDILRFDQDSYQQVLDKWEERENNILNIDGKEYSDPFLIN